MNERDQEAFAAWRPLACVLKVRTEFPLCLEFRLCLEDPGGLYPNFVDRHVSFWEVLTASSIVMFLSV